jgi:hypothetical protein
MASIDAVVMPLLKAKKLGMLTGNWVFPISAILYGSQPFIFYKSLSTNSMTVGMNMSLSAGKPLWEEAEKVWKLALRRLSEVTFASVHVLMNLPTYRDPRVVKSASACIRVAFACGSTH